MTIEEKITQIIVEQLGVGYPEVTPEALFVEDLGVDSLDAVELTMAFEEAFDIEIADEEMERALNVAAAVNYIRARVGLSPVPAPKSEFHRFWAEQSAWSQATFGTDAERGPIGALKHLAKEAKEAQEKPDDHEEYVDCLFLTVDAARRAGLNPDTLLAGAFAKLAKNKLRKWPVAPPDEPSEHIHEEGEE